jgi:hypothetical protein
MGRRFRRPELVDGGGGNDGPIDSVPKLDRLHGQVASLTTHEATVDRCRANVDAAATPSAGFQNQSVFAAF